MTDQELLDAFVRQKDQRAFGELVGRHMDWVYSCARRMVRDEDLAKDVSQAVFVLLAEKAGALKDHPQLAGWLFKVTRYSANNALKQLGRRKRHEREAWEMKMQQASGEEANWEELWPALDEAVGELSTFDRDSVLLRFYQGKTAAQMGDVMGVSEDAAKKRLQRAIERLRNRLIHKGVSVGAVGLTTLMAAKVTQAAPIGLAESAASAATATGTTTLSTGLAKAAAKAMWWAQAKIAAGIVAAAGAAAGTGYGVARHAMAQSAITVNSASTVTTVASIAPVTETAASTDFDPGYEKAPGSSADLTMQVGPNTFAVTAIVRYDRNNKPLTFNSAGKSIDPTSLPLDKVPSPTAAEGDVAVVFLQPGVDRYDIDRLRVFNHYTRRRVNDYLVTPVSGLPALRIVAPAGVFPAKIDLWMDARSYGADNNPVNLGATKESSVKIGSASVGFVEIRDGHWGFPTGSWDTATLDDDSVGHDTTIQLQATGVWDAGQYQVAAVAKSGMKYISSFLINLSPNSMPISSYPVGLAKIDHFELRPVARQKPFFFDGVPVPNVDRNGTAKQAVPEPVIVDAGGKAQVKLPCGAVVELAGISYNPSKNKPWWGIDGKPVAAPQARFGGSVMGVAHARARELFAKLIKKGPGGADLICHVTPSGAMASNFDGRVSRMAVMLGAGDPVNIQLGVSATPWRMLEEIPVENLPCQVKCIPGFIGAPEQGDAKLWIHLGVTSYPSNVRFVLVDQKGALHSWNGETFGNFEMVPPWGLRDMRLSYDGLSAEDVRAVRFEVRDEEYAEFKNVPMEPK